MLRPNSENAWLVTEAPRDWLVSSLPDQQKLRPTSTFTPEFDNSAGIILPIHNEEVALQSALGALVLSSFTFNADVYLLTNASQDKSSEIVSNFLHQIGSVTERPITDGDRAEFKDSRLQGHELTAQRGVRIFHHLDTGTAGKANALNVGNRLALRDGHKIVISMDANNYPEPDALENLWLASNHAFANNPKIRLLNGKAISVGRGFDSKVLFDATKGKFAGIANKPESEVMGWLMSWESTWLEEVGGFPHIAVEDYGIGVVARYNGYKFAKVNDARIWGYEPGNLGDRLRGYRRAARGKIQLAVQHPEFKGIIDEDFHITRSALGRLRALFDWTIKEPGRAPFVLAKFLMWEYALITGYQDFLKDPNNHSWEDVKSTKGRVL